jgi:DNA primase
LYENKQHILEQNCVYVVEGQFDVIKAVEKGFKNIVALGGANMSPYQFSVISRYTDNIFLLLDNDQAGEKGRKLAVNAFGKLANIRNLFLPKPFKDIDEALTMGGGESIPFVVECYEDSRF